MKDKVLVALAIALVVTSLGVGYGAALVASPGGSSTSTTTATQTVDNASAPYKLTLIISTGSIFNSTIGDQPAFFVVGPSGLKSTGQIKLPAHRQIQLVIFNYDDGNASLADPSYSNVTGTAGGTISYGNDGMINASQVQNSIDIKGMVTARSVPADQVAHTFTIPSLGINIPVPVSAVVIASFTLNSTGTFTWFCMTACGSGDNGLGGAMSTPAWMTGSMTAY